MVIDCKSIANEWLLASKKKVEDLNLKEIPQLFCILNKNDPAQRSYLKSMKRAFDQVGIKVVTTPEMPATNIHGAIALDGRTHVPEALDIDCVERSSLRDFYGDVDGCFEPSTAKGICYLLEKMHEVESKNVVIINRSDRIGKPLAHMLLRKNATVSVCHSKTPLSTKIGLINHADVIVTATGRKKELRELFFANPNTLIVDASCWEDEERKLHGDIPCDIHGLIRFTPVPGGIGLLTTAALVDSMVKILER